MSVKRRSNDPRPTWDEYFMAIANVVAKRSNCSRRHVGAVFVKDNHILSTGYNGTPRKVKNCFEGGCPRCSGKAESGSHLEECLCVHAEQNAIIQAAYFGVSVKDSTIYTTTYPCSMCAKILINAGIKEVVYHEGYVDDLSKKLFAETNILIREYTPKKDIKI